jgi:hypothetical protein
MSDLFYFIQGIRLIKATKDIIDSNRELKKLELEYKQAIQRIEEADRIIEEDYQRLIREEIKSILKNDNHPFVVETLLEECKHILLGKSELPFANQWSAVSRLIGNDEVNIKKIGFKALEVMFKNSKSVANSEDIYSFVLYNALIGKSNKYTNSVYEGDYDGIEGLPPDDAKLITEPVVLSTLAHQVLKEIVKDKNFNSNMFEEVSVVYTKSLKKGHSINCDKRENDLAEILAGFSYNENCTAEMRDNIFYFLLNADEIYEEYKDCNEFEKFYEKKIFGLGYILENQHFINRWNELIPSLKDVAENSEKYGSIAQEALNYLEQKQ